MFWPFAWGLTMAAYSQNLPLQSYMFALGLCGCGAFIVRSSACTINDIFDRKVDAGVGQSGLNSCQLRFIVYIERTKNRPLANGRISVTGAILYLLVQYSIGIGCFYLTLENVAYGQFALRSK